MEKWRFRQQSKKQMCHNILFCLGLVIASFIFLSVYSYFTSPFFKGDNGYDAGFFRLVGQGMTRGYLPYRDFFDMKGPYFFFIEYIGQLISYGRVGIFSLQIINLTLVLFLISKIYQLHGIHKRWLQFLLLIPILYVASFTLEGGNVTEEFSLVPLLFCLLLCLRHFASEQEVCKPYNGLCCGICFGYLALIKITHAALIGSIVLVVSIDLLLHRQSKNLLDNALAFIAGVILISLPMVIFYGVHGLLDEMYEAVWVLGFRYSGEKSFLVHLQELIQGEKTQRLLLLIIPFGMGVIAKYPTWKERVILLAGSIFTILGISVGNNYTHYSSLPFSSFGWSGASSISEQSSTISASKPR